MIEAHFNAQLALTGALLVGDPETVVEKILQVNESLGGISRLTFQMSVAALPHARMMRAIEILGTKIRPMVGTALASSTSTTGVSTQNQIEPPNKRLVFELIPRLRSLQARRERGRGGLEIRAAKRRQVRRTN